MQGVQELLPLPYMWSHSPWALLLPGSSPWLPRPGHRLAVLLLLVILSHRRLEAFIQVVPTPCWPYSEPF